MRVKSVEEKFPITCCLCGLTTTTKGFANHLRSKHKMTTKEYYDLYIKQENEGICPVCGKETTYYNFTKGYNKHCSTVCSSNDVDVVNKVKATNNKKYNVDFVTQTQQCITASHSKDAKCKRQYTLIRKYGTTCFIDYDVAHLTRKANGWNRSNSEEEFMETLNSLGIEYRHNYKSEKYPWKCDFYIPSKDLYIELNLFWMHGTHFYTDDDKPTIELWKSHNSDYYNRAITIWTDTDIAKRDCAIKNNLNYIVLWNDSQIEQFWTDFNSGKEFIGCIDYNCT